MKVIEISHPHACPYRSNLTGCGYHSMLVKGMGCISYLQCKNKYKFPNGCPLKNIE